MNNVAIPTDEPMPFAGAMLDRYRHVCAFVDDADEMHRVFDGFVKEGLDHGEKAIHIVDPEERSHHLEHYNQIGIDIASLLGTGQFDLRTWHDAHLHPGHFDQYQMLRLLSDLLSSPQRDGFSRTRLIANMGWAAMDYPGVDDLIEYEARANYVLPYFKDAVFCVYSTKTFGADVMIDVLRTHPMVIIGGVLQVNPFFVPPDEFLEELRQRDSKIINA